MRKNNKKLVPGLIVLCLLLAGIVGAVIFLETGGLPVPDPTDGPIRDTTIPQQTGTAPLPGQTDAPLPGETTAEADLMISTPYCNLHYPAQWKDHVTAEVDVTAYGCVVTFSGTAGGREAALFSVFFAEASDGSFPIGTVCCDGAMTDVSVELYDLIFDSSWEPGDADDLSAMQEGVNYLIDRLEENPVFTPVSSSGGTVPEETAAAVQDLVVPTPYCNLYYPARWKDAVRWEGRTAGAGYIVTFYGTVSGREAELFTVCFAEMSGDSIPVGVYSADGVSMDVGVSIPELADAQLWSQYEQDIFYGMQEQVNYLLEKLREDPAFTFIEE